MNDDYLFDRSGAPDPRVEHLETLLSRYHASGPPPLRAAPPAARRRPVRTLLAVAAVLVLAAAGALLLRPSDTGRGPAGPHSEDWTVSGDTGVHARLARGQSVQTGAGIRKRLSSESIGSVEIAENTTLRLLESRKDRSTLELVVGSIHARTSSPPGVFVVETPRARAVDLGCEYTLRVEPDGEGSLHVDVGWVGLTRAGRQSLVPMRASAVFDAHGNLTPPWFDDAHPDLAAALRRFSFEESPAGSVARERDLARILEVARPRDALTLLNLFPLPGISRPERLAVYDRLNALVPAPATVTREGVADWTVRAADDWWPLARKAAGVGAIQKGKKRAS